VIRVTATSDRHWHPVSIMRGRAPRTSFSSFHSEHDDPARLQPARQRYNRRSKAVSSGMIFFSGCHSIPGTVPAMTQRDWLNTMTATKQESSSKEPRDRLIVCSSHCVLHHAVNDCDDSAYSSPPAS
jgi:hypothetical protein